MVLGTKSMPPPPPAASSIPPPPPKAPPAAGPPMTSPMVSAPAMAPPPATGPPMTAPPAAVPPPPPAGPPAGRMMSPSFGQQAQTPQPPAGPPQVQSFGAMANGIQRPGSVNAGGYRQTPPPPPPHLVQQAMQQQQQQRSVISPPPVSSPPVSNVAAYTVSRPGSVASTRVSEAPAQPSFPPGDRSHIPLADRIIFESLSREIEKAKSRSMAQVSEVFYMIFCLLMLI